MSGKRGLMIAAPHSGCGKTVTTLGLLAALRRQGLDVAAAKAGPDYIDPRFHELACGSASVNLDPWAMDPPRLSALAAGLAGRHVIVEAMMGLFDGAADGRGCAADLAETLGLPVVLVVDAARQSHSVAALARGFRDHRPSTRIAGVILNRVGSDRHEAMLRASLASIDMPVYGAVRRDAALQLPERHLGLVQAAEHGDMARFIGGAADRVGEQVDLATIGCAFAPMVFVPDGKPRRVPPPGQRIALASDAAFSFVYPHMVDDWRAAGAGIVPFSPLADEAPDRAADAIFLPGGYPELHGGTLAQAENFRAGMARHAQGGTLIYGECGGYMVLGEGLEDARGERHQMCGLLALETGFRQGKLHLGYRSLRAPAGFALGERLAGHEFHYTVALKEQGESLFKVADSAGIALPPAGLRRGNVMGSYVHVIDGAAR